MSRLVFWDGGFGGAAEAAVATAITLGLRLPQRLLLVNEGPAESGIEEGLRHTVRQHGSTYGEEAIPEHGLDALLRLQASGRLTRSNFTDYTVPLLRGRLDLVCGTRLADTAWREAEQKGVAEVLAMADQVYDGLILYAQVQRLNEVLQNQREGDVFVAVQPHRLGILDERFAYMASGQGDHRKNLIVAISPFDLRSRWSLTNLKRRYPFSLPMVGLPHHTEFSDAWNDRNILTYFRQKPLLLKRGGERELLLKGYRKLGEMLMEFAASASPSVSPTEKGA
ncbi:MAG: hypothetical protein KZY74_15345 [Paenibacillaceae bacterium]|nr:hypothetical protein [Paenibacillaceae bacterium]